MDFCAITLHSPQGIPQIDQTDSRPEGVQSSSQKSSLQKIITKGSSAKAFLRKDKQINNRHKMSKTLNLSEYLSETKKSSPLDKITAGHKTGEICLEEISTEFTNVSSVHSYEVNINKEAKYCFKKLEDGTFSIEKKPSDDMEQKNQAPSQTESTSKQKPKPTGPHTGRYAYKPLKICFKKRSKTFKKTLEAKDEHQADYVTLQHTNHFNLEKEKQSDPGKKADDSNYSQSSRGTWATIKSLVMPRKRLHPSKMHSYLDSQVHPEAMVGNACLQRCVRKKTGAKLKIPCISFSRDKKKSGPCEVTEEKCCTLKTKGMKDIPRETEANRDERTSMIKSNLHQSLNGASPDKECDLMADEQVRGPILSTGKSPEMGNDTSWPEIIEQATGASVINGKHVQRNPQEAREHRNISENKGEEDLISSSETQRFSQNMLNSKQPAGGVLLPSPELEGQEENAPAKEGERCTRQKARPDSQQCSLGQRGLDDDQDGTERQIISKDTKIHKQNEQSVGEEFILPAYKVQSNEKSENNKTGSPVEHISSVMVSRGDEMCESELCSRKALPTNQPAYHTLRTSDQYEMLLIKAASSLVKTVIQSSVEQVIDEMSFDSNHQPSILQS
ncbi:A-kinase anchor protein 5 [Rhinatrema bivittatum]|uniref:A-kinase anchor protein 5 n=1 Tax=Rhinatrema bivittatum TaxID=194408 RepID=UPI00112C6A82|nr:A-kinase anchor protein 5 [Rhinatrema bivittatum]